MSPSVQTSSDLHSERYSYQIFNWLIILYLHQSYIYHLINHVSPTAEKYSAILKKGFAVLYYQLLVKNIYPCVVNQWGGCPWADRRRLTSSWETTSRTRRLTRTRRYSSRDTRMPKYSEKTLIKPKLESVSDIIIY